jgi:hypothetical protein
VNDEDKPRRWRVKESIFSAWRELAGNYTAGEIFHIKLHGNFPFAEPVFGDEQDAGKFASSDLKSSPNKK